MRKFSNISDKKIHLVQKKKVRCLATPNFHNIENEQKNYLVIATKYLVTLQNSSGLVICRTTCVPLFTIV